MVDEMGLKEASKYLGVSPDRVLVLVGAHEIEGHQAGQEWRLNRASVIAYKAREIVQQNSTQGIEEERNPTTEDEAQSIQEHENPASENRPVMDQNS